MGLEQIQPKKYAPDRLINGVSSLTLLQKFSDTSSIYRKWQSDKWKPANSMRNRRVL